MNKQKLNTEVTTKIKIHMLTEKNTSLSLKPMRSLIGLKSMRPKKMTKVASLPTQNFKENKESTL